jgi:hypothetical protein
MIPCELNRCTNNMKEMAWKKTDYVDSLHEKMGNVN